MQLNFRQYSSSGDPLLVMHGLFGSLGNWGWHSKQLSEDYTVYGVDLRNHGQSPHSDALSYPLMAQDMLAFMDREGIDSASLIGHSMGGKVAMQMALLAPERVDKLVVVDIAPVDYGGPTDHTDVIAGMEAVAAAKPKKRTEADALLAEHIAEEGVRQFIMTNLVREQGGQYSWRLNLAAIKANYDLLRRRPEGDGPFEGEVLFIKGANSDYIKADYRDSILALFPASQVKVIMDAGHWVHAEKPEVLLRIVREFLGQGGPAVGQTA